MDFKSYRNMKNLKFGCLILFTIFWVGNVYGQNLSHKIENQCQQLNQKGFEGEKINFNVVNTDLEEFLNSLTDKFGCHFVVDKSVGKVALTVQIDDFPWNFALEMLLNKFGLGLQFKEPIIRIALKETLASEKGYLERREAEDTRPLQTEFIKLRNISNESEIKL
jgi:type II secretory pathway component GspD/PulD (secretin)